MTQVCPQCGGDIEREEDEQGVAYQCHNMSCLGFFGADEIEIRCAECDCDNGGRDCNWIKGKVE